jgi:ABC-2 type transport system ATP-binding protein
MAEPVLEFRNVSKNYRSDWAFRNRPVLFDISFSIQSGESVGFIGHNGAGKSTTMRIALGLQYPSSGEVLVNGMPPSVPAARRGVAYVPEDPLLYGNISPEQWLVFTRQFAGTWDASARGRADVAECLDRFDLKEYRNVPVRKLSKGLAQRVAIAAAFFSSPHFMILDEPMTGLDPLARRNLTEALGEYRKNGGALFFSSHALLELDRLSDRFIGIREGRLCASGTWADMLPSAGLEDRFVLEVESAQDLPDFERISSARWQRTVNSRELPEIIGQLNARQDVRILSVTPPNDRERVYLSLLQRQG